MTMSLPGRVADRRGAHHACCPQSGQVGRLSAFTHQADRRIPELSQTAGRVGELRGAPSGILLALCKLHQLLAHGFTPSQCFICPYAFPCTGILLKRLVVVTRENRETELVTLPVFRTKPEGHGGIGLSGSHQLSHLRKE